ncbi:MAG: leucine-rich repeat domain-containing protein [Clostridia bacterium]|nr:leucine-rich repeat domain-containing protein [Clostridia bacterium]
MKRLVSFLLLIGIVFVFCSCDTDEFEGKRPLDYPNSSWVCEEYAAYFSVDSDGKFKDTKILINSSEIPFEFLFSKFDNKATMKFETNSKSDSFSGECEFSDKKFVFNILDTKGYFSDDKVSLTFIRQVNNIENNFAYVVNDDAVTIISYRDFNATVVNVPNTIAEKPVKILGQDAFYQHTRLVAVSLPDSLTTIKGGPFYRCYSLEKISIPENVSWIECNPFFRCSSLTEITVDLKNDYFADIDGVLFNKDKTVLIAYPEGKNATEYTVPDTVKEIYGDAFGYKTNLKRIIIPSSVTDFADYNMFVFPDDVILVVENGSAAEQYAKSHNLKYENYTAK